MRGRLLPEALLVPDGSQAGPRSRDLKRLLPETKDADVNTTSIQFAIAALIMEFAAFSGHPQQTSSPVKHPQATAEHSKVRIVRLSEVKGDVILDRNPGKGFETAFSNLPIIEGSRLQTGVGRAEVEFEDNSTVCLAPFTLIEFSRLQLLPSGGKASTVEVLKGTAYVSLMPSYLVSTKGNDFLLNFGQEKLHLKPSDHIRIEVDDAEARVAVLDGAGMAAGPFGSMKLSKKKTFTFSLANSGGPVATKHVHFEPLDKWDSIETEIHKRNAIAGRSPGAGPKPRSTVMWHDLFK
jgi:hypothetical protein